MIYLPSIFLGAFLLFQVQPMIAKYILPWYGGTPAVWTFCMLFFQVGLLGGYYYAHILTTKFNVKKQVMIHMALLLISLLIVPITPEESLKPTGTESPILGILWLLFSTVGFPYLLVSASAPLLQKWFATNYSNKSPYRLYALSNVGSLLGLLTYPFLFEPMLTLDSQTLFWSLGYGAYIIFCGLCGFVLMKKVKENPSLDIQPLSTLSGSSQKDLNPPSMMDRLLWVALSATGSVLLLAFTNKLTQDVAVIPFLWVLPLSLYLITFIIAFDSPTWYKRAFWIPAALLGIVVSLFILYRDQEFDDVFILYQVIGYSISMFFLVMVCHGEMVHRKPSADYLTSFYLLVSAGGALGGVFVSLIVPLIFRGYWEIHTSLALVLIIGGIAFYKSTSHKMKPIIRKGYWGIISLGSIAVFAIMAHSIINIYKENLEVTRNFFGVIQVLEEDEENSDHRYEMYHGRILHGMQYRDPEKMNIPLSYFDKRSGVGIALMNYNNRLLYTPSERKKYDLGIKVGIIGQGVGTLASYSLEDDHFKFYEINPEVDRLAQKYFSYISEAKGEIEVVMGDGRISLERELQEGGSQEFDVLVIDAFSGDAIPVHLLTKEAFELYFEHLEDDGILAVHITNLHLDLQPVVKGIAKTLDLPIYYFEQHNTGLSYDNSWVLLGKNKSFFSSPTVLRHVDDFSTEKPDNVWTDNFSDLFSIIYRNH